MAFTHTMDPVLHLMLPTLLLLALRLEPRSVVLLSPLAILPDFDAAVGLHRAALHNFIFTVLVPVAIIVYARLRKPEWLMGALLVQFFLASHVLLDLGGVSFFWPVYEKMFYFDPEVTFNLQGGINFDFKLDYGWKEFEKMGTTSFISEEGFALLFLGLLMLVVFRKEAWGGLRKLWGILGNALLRARKA